MAVTTVSSSEATQTFPVGSKEAADAVSPTITEIVMRLLQAAQYRGEATTLDTSLGSLSAREVTPLSFHASKRKSQITEAVSILEALLSFVDDRTQFYLQPHVNALKDATPGAQPSPVAAPLQVLLLRVVSLAKNMGILQACGSILRTKLNAEQRAMEEVHFAQIGALPQGANNLTAEIAAIKETLDGGTGSIKPILAYAIATLENTFQVDGEIRITTITDKDTGNVLGQRNISRYISLRTQLLQLASQAEFIKLLARLDQEIALLDPLPSIPPELQPEVVLARIASQFLHICAIAGNRTLFLQPVDLRSLEKKRMLVSEKQRTLEEAGSLDPATPFPVLPFVENEKHFAVICFLEKILSKLAGSVLSEEERTTCLADIRRYINSTLTPGDQESLNESLAKGETQFRSPHNGPTVPLHMHIDWIILLLDRMDPLSLEALADAAKGPLSDRMQYRILEELHCQVTEIGTRPDPEQQALLKAAFDTAVKKGLSEERQKTLLKNIFEIASEANFALAVEAAAHFSGDFSGDWTNAHAFDNWAYFVTALEILTNTNVSAT